MSFVRADYPYPSPPAGDVLADGLRRGPLPPKVPDAVKQAKFQHNVEMYSLQQQIEKEKMKARLRALKNGDTVPVGVLGTHWGTKSPQFGNNTPTEDSIRALRMPAEQEQ